MSKVTFPNSNIENITISGLIYKPNNFEESKKYPAVVVAHPTTGVKEQTASLYARKLSEYGFITIAFDRSYQGESTGEPRHLENPYVSAEDISAAIDYLTSLPYVDNERIGCLGICAGGGYSVNATINDRRIKALAGVSPVNIGLMYRRGWEGNTKPADAFPFLESASQVRTSDAESGKYQTFPLMPSKREECFNEEYKEGYDYYNARAKCSTSTGVIVTRSLNQLVTYDAYASAEDYLTQPLLLIAGSKAGTKWFSEELIKRAASDNNKLHIVEGASHFDLYDGEKYVEEAISQIGPFFTKHL